MKKDLKLAEQFLESSEDTKLKKSVMCLIFVIEKIIRELETQDAKER